MLKRRGTRTPEASSIIATQEPPKRPSKKNRARTPVDLTDDDTQTTPEISTPTFASASSPVPTTTPAEPPLKRQRISTPPARPSAPKNFNMNGAEEIDLTDADDEAALNVLLRKSQEDRLKAQNPTVEKRKLGNIQCVICLDDPTDLAATPCGHLFCNQCLQGALRAGPQPNPKHGRCPVCRRKVMHKDITLLEIKRIVKPQSEKSKGKMKAR